LQHETAYEEAFKGYKTDIEKVLGQMRRHKSVLAIEY